MKKFFFFFLLCMVSLLMKFNMQQFHGFIGSIIIHNMFPSSLNLVVASSRRHERGLNASLYICSLLILLLLVHADSSLFVLHSNGLPHLSPFGCGWYNCYGNHDSFITSLIH